MVFNNELISIWNYIWVLSVVGVSPYLCATSGGTLRHFLWNADSGRCDWCCHMPGCHGYPVLYYQECTLSAANHGVNVNNVIQGMRMVCAPVWVWPT